MESWPKDTDKVFAEGSYGPAQAYLQFAKFHQSDVTLADAFKNAADMIVSQIAEGKLDGHADYYFFPVAYMYRHAVELYLK